MNKRYGKALLNALYANTNALGRVLVVMSASNYTNSNYQEMAKELTVDSNGRVRFFNTLALAYAEAESNNNDTIVLDANGTHTLTTGLAWTKNRINVIGFDGGGRMVQQGAKIQVSGAVDTAYVLKVTGVRNSFRNIKIIQASTHANALSALQCGGEGNLYENVTATFGVVDNLDQTNAFEVINGEDSGTFINCEFGTETLLTSAARAVMSLDMVTASQEFKSNRFKGCRFIISSSSSTATHIRAAAITDILFTSIFDECIFAASIDTAGGAAIAETVQTGTGTNKGTLLFRHPATFNSTDFATATGGRNAGVQIVGVVPTAGTAGIGVTPTA